MIAIVDYGRGNLFSLRQALLALGHEHEITSDAGRLEAFDTVILPGVGAFGDAMTKLKSLGMDEALVRAAARGARVLGICLGMQLLAERSEEFGDHEGLNLIAGKVLRLPQLRDNSERTRIPNIGWRRVTAHSNDPILEHITGEPYFYFVHSYGFRCANAENLIGSIAVNGEKIAAIVRHGNVWGCQFHPEKSGPDGLRMLDQMVRASGALNNQPN